ncbi:MAG: LLM class flavin-dependent oxidoreductase [Actinomycetota bacterium]|nr:LLM class flavin-dependent oxidoreductase [Actinomycetota bacterium]
MRELGAAGPLVHWFLPTSGDGRGVGDGTRTGVVAPGHRPPTLEYLAQIARAADDLGFDGVLTPTGTWCEDAWLVTAALIRETRRLRFLVAFRPGLVTPTLAAQMAATFQRLSGGRAALNVVSGGEEAEQRRFGDWLDHDERYGRADEFLVVVRGAWGDAPFDFHGRHYRVEGATVRVPPQPAPPLYFGGASPAAEAVAARRADVYLLWGEPPEMVRERIARVQALASAEGRRIRFGIRLHVIARDRPERAWAVAERWLDEMDPAAVELAQARLARSSSVGQQRMLALHGGSRDRLLVAPNLWAGVGLVRGNAGTALVGSHTEVAERIEEYRELGCDEFILSGFPHLEEAYWVAEGVLPLLRRSA